MNVACVALVFLLVGTKAAPLLAAPHAQLLQARKGGFGNTTSAQQKEAPLCGVTSKVASSSSKYDMCPEECPYWSQNRVDTEVCTFLCVAANECKDWNPNKPIADTIKKSRTCRGPRADFCSEPAMDGTDTCVKCQAGFALNEVDGTCNFQHWNAIYIVTCIIVLIVVVVVVWVVDWCCRPTINEAEVTKAQHYRARAKVLQPKNVDGHRHPYPMNTNLCKTDVAGLGMLLHFNFQAFCIGWPLVIALIWCILACFHEELWVLGTKKFGTPRHNCILVAWGYETQQRLMWTKVLFLVIVYLFSFVSFLLFSVRQYRIYQHMDAHEKTMKKFAVELRGIEGRSATSTIETDIQKAVEKATGKQTVGVSIAWQYGDNEDTEKIIMDAVKLDQDQRQQRLPSPRPSPRTAEDQDDAPPMNTFRQKVYNFEKDWITGEQEDQPDPEQQKANENELVKTLGELKASDTAFVVFRTSEDAEEALKATSETNGFSGGKALGDSTLTLAAIDFEPRTVNWQNFGDNSPGALAKAIAKGFFTIYLPALSIWFFVFYVPYALSLYNFNYDNGAELPGYYSIIFTMVVVGGNATMYIVCDLCADEMRFKFKDTKACMYMVMYLFACMFNVVLDMVVTYYTAMKIMIGLDFRTYHGERLEDIEAFTDQFETYAMQRSLGGNTYAYAFPSTFLVPFLIEPVITILVPYQLGMLIIRTHKEVKGRCAEEWLASTPFDLGRYADILLNVFLGILIFYFPGGYTWSLFFGMFISHIVIYLFDHWRVLDSIPNIQITTYQVDFWAQVMLAGCCALILSCLVFKANCESYAGYCMKDMKLISATTLAGVAHFVVHTLLLIYLVPIMGKEVEDKKEAMEYSACAENDAYSWFAVNPVHCMRSKYIHKHDPPCVFVSEGKEHLLEKNPAIGCYFKDDAADVEDMSAGGAMKALRKSLTASMLQK